MRNGAFLISFAEISLPIEKNQSWTKDSCFMLWDFQSKLVIADEFPRHLIMDDGCRDYFSGKLIKNGGFLVSVAGRRPAIGEFAWFLAKTHSAMKDSRWGSGMKVARSASAIARKRRTRAKARDYVYAGFCSRRCSRGL